MANKKVLIAGASGVIGFAAMQRFARSEGWEVIGVSRRKPAGLPANVEHLAVDLTDVAATKSAFGGLNGVTHVAYAALFEKPGLFAGWLDEETMEVNAAMLRNIMEPLLEASPIEHVSLLHGTKAYGLHHPSIPAETVRNPLREREPRREHPNFYWLQEDYLREKQKGAAWDMTVWRPTVVYGVAGANNMNPIPVIGAYAAILREQGEPLHFPGAGGFSVVREAVDADLIASALHWAAEFDAARGGTFNLTNGDVFTWTAVWPAIAASMGMEAGDERPMRLAEWLPENAATWRAIVERHGLIASPDVVDYAGYNSIVYADMAMGAGRGGSQPILNSTIAGRQAGFQDCIDTEHMFVKIFQTLQATKQLPPA